MCEACQLIASTQLIGGDEDIAIVVPHVAAGAVMIIPKRHATLAELPKALQQKLLVSANSFSALIYEQLQVHGTNIIVKDGEHGMYTVVARKEEDGLDLRWKPGKATQDDLANTAKKIKEETWYIGKQPDNKPEEKTKSYEEHRVEGTLPKVTLQEAPKVSMSRPGFAPPQSAVVPPAEDDDPNVDTPTEVADRVQTRVKKGPTDEHNYLIKQLTRRR